MTQNMTQNVNLKQISGPVISNISSSENEGNLSINGLFLLEQYLVFNNYEMKNLRKSKYK